MRLRNAGVAKVVACGLLGLSAVACDPGSELTLQIYNSTGHQIRVTVPRTAAVRGTPPPGQAAVDVILVTGEMKEAKIGLGAGAEGGTVRAYWDDRLIFCQNYDYHTGPGDRVTWSVDIVEGQINCQ